MPTRRSARSLLTVLVAAATFAPALRADAAEPWTAPAPEGAASPAPGGSSEPEPEPWSSGSMPPQTHTGWMGTIGMSLIGPGAALTIIGGGMGLTAWKEDLDDPKGNRMALGLAGVGLTLLAGGITLMVLDVDEDTSVGIGAGTVDVRGSF